MGFCRVSMDIQPPRLWIQGRGTPLWASWVAVAPLKLWFFYTLAYMPNLF